MAHPELGSKILDDVLEAVGPAAKVDTQARLEGRSMSMTLSPDKQAQEAMKKAALEAERRSLAEASEAEAEARAPESEAETPEADEADDTIVASEQSEGASDAEDENVEDGS